MVYINSLEALNQNYQKGAKYFELDIRSTSDSKLVAVHDWNEWAEKSGYAGSLPPSYDEFLSTKVDGLTPLDVRAIVNWFEARPDSYLVTDKIDDPFLVRASFPFYKQRVLMEVFSWESHQVAKEVGIWGSMINGNLLLNDNYLRDIELNGVKFVALSRRLLPANLDRVEKMGQFGVKVYLYHAQEDGYTDHLTFDNYIPQAYGIYFDHWIDSDD
jgi:glycerophosphoryl diester phosphodiesterase